jgi:hypothetical protein
MPRSRSPSRRSRSRSPSPPRRGGDTFVLDEHRFREWQARVTRDAQAGNPQLLALLFQGQIPVPKADGYVGVRVHDGICEVNLGALVAPQLEAEADLRAFFYGGDAPLYSNGCDEASVFLQMLRNGRMLSNIKVDKRKGGWGGRVIGLPFVTRHTDFTLADRPHSAPPTNQNFLLQQWPAKMLDGSREKHIRLFARLPTPEATLAAGLVFRLTDFDVLCYENDVPPRHILSPALLAHDAYSGEVRLADADTPPGENDVHWINFKPAVLAQARGALPHPRHGTQHTALGLLVRSHLEIARHARATDTSLEDVDDDHYTYAVGGHEYNKAAARFAAP